MYYLTKIAGLVVLLGGNLTVYGISDLATALPKQVSNYWNARTARYKNVIDNLKKNDPICAREQQLLINDSQQILACNPFINPFVLCGCLSTGKTGIFAQIKKLMDNKIAVLEKNTKELENNLLENNQTLQLFVSKIEDRVERLDIALKEVVFSLTNGFLVLDEHINAIEQQTAFILGIIALFDYTTELENEIDKTCEKQNSPYWVFKELFESKIRDLRSQETNPEQKLAACRELLTIKNNIFDAVSDSAQVPSALKTCIAPIGAGISDDYKKCQNLTFREYLDTHHKNLAAAYENFDPNAPLTYVDYLELTLTR